jgi:hypothetical protein
VQSYTTTSTKPLLILYSVAIGVIRKRSNAPAKSHARDAEELAMQLSVAMQTAIVRFGLTKGAAQDSLSSKLHIEKIQFLTWEF